MSPGRAASEALTHASLAGHGIPLAEVLAQAELLARFDRSYLVPVDVFESFAARLTDPRAPGGAFRVLSLDGRRRFAYHSRYFDTEDLRLFRAHRQRRRRRFKVRERLYRDTGERQFEVKVKSGRGETVKHRLRLVAPGGAPTDCAAAPAGPPDEDRLTFLDAVLRKEYGLGAPPGLVPFLDTEYVRSTFVAPGARVTCDAGLRVRRVADGAVVGADPALVLVETKSAGHLTEADRLLHQLGVREGVFSKYPGAVLALGATRSCSPWARAVHRVFPGCG